MRATAHDIPLTVSRLCAGSASRWSSFVEDSANGTIFHRPEFLDYHEEGRFDWHHLMFGNPGTPTALLPAAVTVESEKRTIRSPVGATFGGLVVKQQMGLEHTVELVRSLKEFAQNDGFQQIIMGTVPWIYWKRPDDTLEFALRGIGFQPNVQLCHYIDLASLSGADVLAHIPGRRRVRFRKAQRQDLCLYEATTLEEMAEFYDVLLANKRANCTSPVHSLDEIASLKQRLKDDLSIYTARKGQKTVAGIYCIRANPHVAYTQYIADDPEHRDLEATRFVLLEMLKLLRDQGIKYLDLGPSVLLPIEKYTLARFKESFGAVGFQRTEWRLPLTS